MVDPSEIWNSASLPTLPTVAVRLLDLSKDPETEMKDVIDVIRTDPAITAKILKSTNSSFFGFKSKVTSIDRAVPLLGTTVVTSLALSFSLVEAAMTSGPLARHYNDYWMQSIVQAVTAEVLAEYSSDGLDCEYFLSGLLCDLGRLAMLKTIGEDYIPVLEAAAEGQQLLCDLEREMIKVDHVEVGMRLMENWNLPVALVAGVRWHHATADQIQTEVGEGEDTQLVTAVAVASAVGDYFCSECKGPALERLRELTTRFYDFDEEKLDAFLAKTKERVDQAGDMFNVNTDDLGDPSDLMALASEHLAQLAMREHVASTQATAQRDAAEREKDELVSQNEQLQKQAMHDTLTKAYNRQFFDETLAQGLRIDDGVVKDC